MGLRIGTNVQSIAAQRNLAHTTQAHGHSMERLASGTRITRAADDAAGLAISENMRAQIRTLRQDARNANDGVSMIQTAEGAIAESGNILVRLRELSIQSASDTVGDSERGFIDKEVQALKGELDRIASVTEYNGFRLLNGSGDVLEFQVGMHNDPELDRFRFDLEQTDVRLSTLGLGSLRADSQEDAWESLDSLDQALTKVNGNRSTLGALQNRLQSTINSLGIYEENLSAARSRIYDVDMAMETSEQVKQQILGAAGVSVLGQANQAPTAALRLLG